MNNYREPGQQIVWMEEASVKLKNGLNLHYVTSAPTSPSKKAAIILIHGGDKVVQNAQHWKSHFSYFPTQGTFYALDLLGHGKSVSETQADVPTQANAVMQLIEQKIKPDEKLVLLGRSYGGKVVMEIANEMAKNMKANQLHGLVFIAPAVDESVLASSHKDVLSKPCLLYWAEDDPILPFSRSAYFPKYFSNTKLVNFGKIRTNESMEKWRSHCPENEKPSLFQDELSQFISKL